MAIKKWTLIVLAFGFQSQAWENSNLNFITFKTWCCGLVLDGAVGIRRFRSWAILVMVLLKPRTKIAMKFILCLFLFRRFSSRNACICSTRSSSVSSLELSFFLFCELSLTLDDAILIGQPNLLVLTQSIYWHHGHVEWSILLLFRRYYKWWLYSFWERDCVGQQGQSLLPRRRACLRAELGSLICTGYKLGRLVSVAWELIVVIWGWTISSHCWILHLVLVRYYLEIW